MHVGNTHWTYCTQFSQSYKTTWAPLHPERTVPPWKRRKIKRESTGGMLLSCQLMINGSASHLHRHGHNVPGLTTHTLFHCSKGGCCRPTGLCRHCVAASPTFTLKIWPHWQTHWNNNNKKKLLSCLPLPSCMSLMTPSAPVSLVCSKQLCICL